MFNGIIYLATNTINGNVYIGKTSQSLKSRITKHKYSAKTNTKRPFCRAIQKYGIEAFSWKILEEASNDTSLNSLEVYSIQQYKDKGYVLYNATVGGDGVSGYNRTEKQKENHSAFMKSFYNKNTSAREHLSNITKKQWSDETYRNGRCKKVRNVETGEVFPSVSEAIRRYGKSIDAVLSGKRKTVAGYHWEYAS